MIALSHAGVVDVLLVLAAISLAVAMAGVE